LSLPSLRLSSSPLVVGVTFFSVNILLSAFVLRALCNAYTPKGWRVPVPLSLALNVILRPSWAEFDPLPLLLLLLRSAILNPSTADVGLFLA